jgi:hypothetical protein
MHHKACATIIFSILFSCEIPLSGQQMYTALRDDFSLIEYGDVTCASLRFSFVEGDSVPPVDCPMFCTSEELV